MQKMLRKILIMGVVLIMCAGVLCACNDKGNSNDKGNGFDNKFNAKLYDTIIENLNEDYLLENSTLGTPYNDVHLENDTRPCTMTKIINEQSDFNLAFRSFQSNLDFNKEMLILYFFSGDGIVNSYTGERIFIYSIKDIVYKEAKLEIVIGKKKVVNGPTGSPLTQEFLVVKMDKLDIEIVDIKIIYE